MFKIRQNNKLHKSNLFPCCNNNNNNNNNNNTNTNTNSQKIKVIRNYNAYNVPQNTQVQRTVDTILYSLGGRIQYGYRQPQRREKTVLDCKLEGQNTGILAPLKNKF
jgi:hypothetical protein